jgi:uncharacterized protein (TIGR04255 family)
MRPETTDRSATSQEQLPYYESPPVFETVLGVRFPSLGKWDIPHFGLYSALLRDDYPEFETKAPLMGTGAMIGVDSSSIELQIATRPEVRCWFFGARRDSTPI